MLPFLLLSIRAEDAAADEEYEAIRSFAGLTSDGLHRIRLDRAQLGRIELADWSGIILGGGAYNASDVVKPPDQQRAETSLLGLLDDVVAADFPFLGCCYGVGVVGMWLGATIDHTYAEPVGAVPVTLTPAGRADPITDGLPDAFDAFVGHKESVGWLPPTATVLASSPTCPVQAFRVGANVYATQFHPELDVPGICTRIETYKHHGYFEPSTADALQAAMRRTSVAHPPRLLRNFATRYGR